MVINVVDIQPASVKPLAEVKDDITSEIRKQLAAEQFAQLASKLTSLVYDQRDSLAPIATALNVPIKTVSGLARDGLLPASQHTGALPTEQDRLIFGNLKVRQAVFSSDVLKEKFNSGCDRGFTRCDCGCSCFSHSSCPWFHCSVSCLNKSNNA